MKLLIVRHAIAEDRESFRKRETDDDLRPLTEAGQRKMRRIAPVLARLVDRPEVIYVSPLLRAKQTAFSFREVWEDVKIVETASLRPEAKPETSAAWFAKKIGTNQKTLVILVGHEPHLTTLAKWLTSASVRMKLELKKGGAIMLDCGDGLGKGSSTLKWLFTPRVLTELSSVRTRTVSSRSFI